MCVNKEVMNIQNNFYLYCASVCVWTVGVVYIVVHAYISNN